MKFKNKGRKIYKTKEKNYYGKSPVGKAFSVGLTVLLIGGIVFIGYSVAEPLINYTKKKGDSTAESEMIASDTTPTDENGEPVTEEGAAPQVPVSAEVYRAYALDPLDIADAQSIKAALKRVPSEEKIEYIEVPLKVSGGNIYYATNNYYATSSGVIQSYTKLSEIVSAISSEGYKPVALISTFNDNIIPNYFRDMSYLTVDDGSQWIDNDINAGGKPWMTPFSESAVEYNTDIAEEVAQAGFERVVCYDFVFPDFRPSDVEFLGEKVVSPDRYMALTSAANMMYDKIMTEGSKMMLEVNASDLLKGKNDVLQPMLLKVNTIILNIDLDLMSYGVYTGDTVYEFTGTPAENVRKMLDLVSEDVSDFNVAVRVSGTTLSTQEMLEAKEEIVGYGFDSYVLG
ncbi:putative glycoside hydrolase [Ruminococcus flavefaciens]|uniref:Putative glycosyl hydrolase protein n=1 Tax=Ruminococcus flavefaciens TaxID=1265 RepID=A0A315Y4N6_RUMFL|nr:putative glycoside hydrolase [Ruminococcus flavefaciens]PWJ15362.1 putative glycosyl hydrolase protein [Ruminococcus flavefaciens]SSA40492.1 Putative glycosyl hydrolase domain-containing protein [Ruminococcus flavefaciens]